MGAAQKRKHAPGGADATWFFKQDAAEQGQACYQCDQG